MVVYQYVAECPYAQTPAIRLLRPRVPMRNCRRLVLGDEESATRPPLNFGEAIIVLPRTEANEDQISRFFQNFYNGLPHDHRAWVPYIDEENKSPFSSTLPMMS
jgi:hypothetical protein